MHGRAVFSSMFLYLSIVFYYFTCARSSLKALYQEMLTGVADHLIQSYNPLENYYFSEIATKLYPFLTQHLTLFQADSGFQGRVTKKLTGHFYNGEKHLGIDKCTWELPSYMKSYIATVLSLQSSDTHESIFSNILRWSRFMTQNQSSCTSVRNPLLHHL